MIVALTEPARRQRSVARAWLSSGDGRTVCALLDGADLPWRPAEADATALKKIEAVTAMRKPSAGRWSWKRHEQVACEQHNDQPDGRRPTDEGNVETGASSPSRHAR